MNYSYMEDNKYLLNGIGTIDAKLKKNLVLKMSHMNQYTFKKFYQYLKNRHSINTIIKIQ